MLVNKRPLCFNSSLNKLESDASVIGAITPEMVVKGFDIPCINIIPQVNTDFGDCDYLLQRDQGPLVSRYKTLCGVRAKLRDVYHREFIGNLVYQATNKRDRFSKTNHLKLRPGDVVSIKIPMSKPYQYPMAVVSEVEENDLDEVVAATVRKSNGEFIRRHVTDLVHLFHSGFIPVKAKPARPAASEARQQPSRKAAEVCSRANRNLIAIGQV